MKFSSKETADLVTFTEKILNRILHFFVKWMSTENDFTSTGRNFSSKLMLNIFSVFHLVLPIETIETFMWLQVNFASADSLWLEELSFKRKLFFIQVEQDLSLNGNHCIFCRNSFWVMKF